MWWAGMWSVIVSCSRTFCGQWCMPIRKLGGKTMRSVKLEMNNPDKWTFVHPALWPDDYAGPHIYSVKIANVPDTVPDKTVRSACDEVRLSWLVPWCTDFYLDWTMLAEAKPGQMVLMRRLDQHRLCSNPKCSRAARGACLQCGQTVDLPHPQTLSDRYGLCPECL